MRGVWRTPPLYPLNWIETWRDGWSTPPSPPAKLGREGGRWEMGKDVRGFEVCKFSPLET